MKTPQAHTVTDRELVGRYLKGNEYSLEILVQRHQNRIFSYIMMIVKDISGSQAYSMLSSTLVKDKMISAGRER